MQAQRRIARTRKIVGGVDLFSERIEKNLLKVLVGGQPCESFGSGEERPMSGTRGVVPESFKREAVDRVAVGESRETYFNAPNSSTRPRSRRSSPASGSR